MRIEVANTSRALSRRSPYADTAITTIPAVVNAARTVWA